MATEFIKRFIEFRALRENIGEMFDKNHEVTELNINFT